jgi:hypothetical protein
LAETTHIVQDMSGVAEEAFNDHSGRVDGSDKAADLSGHERTPFNIAINHGSSQAAAP